jgi:hypothetical protein
MGAKSDKGLSENRTHKKQPNKKQLTRNRFRIFEYSKGRFVDFFPILWIPELIEEKERTMPSYTQFPWLSQCPQAVSFRLSSEAEQVSFRTTKYHCLAATIAVTLSGLDC